MTNRRLALLGGLALLLIAPMVTWPSWRLLFDPNRPWIDMDGDGLYERAALWDADGDGSTLQTCTAKDLPVPQCKIAGERVYPDFADDLNCAIHGCAGGGNRKMETDGTIELLSGVVYALFPCWDFGAWDADPATPTGCPAAGINDPRAACQAGGTDTRWNDDATDAAVYADCAVDPDGKPMMVASFLDWQGTLEGGGVDIRENETANLVAGGRNLGTTIAIDTGNEDTAWFLGLGGGFVRSIQLGRYDFGVPTSDPSHSHGGASALTADSKGWGNTRPFSGVNFHNAGYSELRGAVCVCDAVSCGASANDWIDNLVDGDLMFVQLVLHPGGNVYAPTTLAINGAGTSFTQGGCEANHKQVPIGARDPATRPSEIPWGAITADFGLSFSHPRASSFTNNTTLRNFTVQPQDFYHEAGGDCSKTGLYLVGGDATARDIDCDTQPMFATIGNGDSLLEGLVIKNWQHFAINGGPHVGKTRLHKLQFWYGNGAAFADDSHIYEWDDIRIESSNFTGAMLGGFFSHTKYENFWLNNVQASAIAQPTYSTEGVEFRQWRITNSSFLYGWEFGCGSKNNILENIRVYGRRVISEGQIFPLVRFTCPNIMTNTSFCDTSGALQDRGGTSTDFWCDAAIENNVVRDVMEWPPGGDAIGYNSLASIDTAAETITFQNPLDFYECQLLFTNLPTATCNGGSCSTNWYVLNPNYATNAIQLSSTCNGAAQNLAGTVATTDSAVASAGFQSLQSRLSQVLVQLDATDGQEAAIRNNVFDSLHLPQPLAPSRCRAAGVGCDEENPLSRLIAVSFGAEEVLAYNTLSNSSVASGDLVGACRQTRNGFVCPDVGPLTSMALMPGPNNQIGGRVMKRSAVNAYEGKWSEVTFCGDLATAADATWWFPPVSDVASYAALVDDRVQRLARPATCASRLGVTENQATVDLVNEPVTVTGDPVLEVTDMHCYITGDVAGNVTFQLVSDADCAAGGEANVAGFSCTVTAGANFDNYCSAAPTVALSTAPATIAAGGCVAMLANNISGDNSGNDGLCVVRTRPRL